MKKLMMGALSVAAALFTSAVFAAEQVVVDLVANNDQGYVKSGRNTTRNNDYPGEVTFTVNENAKVALRAYADKGYTFTAWTISAGEYDSSKAKDVSITVKATETFEAKATFIEKTADVITLADTIDFGFAANEPMVEIDLIDDGIVGSASKATVSVSGLPTGVKFNAKTMTISGTPTIVKDGVVTISVKNASGIKATGLYPYSVKPLAWDEYVRWTPVADPMKIAPNVQYKAGDTEAGNFLPTAGKSVILTAKNLPYGLSLQKYAKNDVYGYFVVGKASRKTYSAWYDVEFTAKVGKATTETKVQRVYIDMPRVQVNTIYVDEKDSILDYRNWPYNGNPDQLKGGVAFLKPTSNYYMTVPTTLAGYMYFFLETGDNYITTGQGPYNRYGNSGSYPSQNNYMTFTSKGYAGGSLFTANLTMTNLNMSVTDFTDYNDVIEDYGEVKGPARYAEGQKVTLKANSKSGYVFAGWRVIKKANFRTDVVDSEDDRYYHGYNGWADYCRRTVKDGSSSKTVYRLPYEIADVDLVQQAKYNAFSKNVNEKSYYSGQGTPSDPWNWNYDSSIGKYYKYVNVTYKTNTVDVVGYQPVDVVDFDARNPNYSFKMGGEDVTYYALYVKRSTDMKPGSLKISVGATVGTTGATSKGDYHYQKGVYSYSGSNPGTPVYEKNGFSDVDNAKSIVADGTSVNGGIYYCVINNAIDPIVLSDNSQSYATYTVKGLPYGLKFDAKNNVITGTPTVAGKKVVTVTVKNADNITASTTFTIWVAPIANYAVGSFSGVASLGVGTNGTFTLTVDAKGNAKGTIVFAQNFFGWKLGKNPFSCKLTPVIVTTKMNNAGTKSTSYYYDETTKKSDTYLKGDDFIEVAPYVQMYVGNAQVRLFNKLWNLEFRITTRTTDTNLTALEESGTVDSTYEYTDLSWDLDKNVYPTYYNPSWDQQYWVKSARGVVSAIISDADDTVEYEAFATQADTSKNVDLRIKNVNQFNYFLEKDVDPDARYVSSTKQGIVKYTRMINGRKVTISANMVPVYGRETYGPSYTSTPEGLLYYSILGVYQNEEGYLVVDEFKMLGTTVDFSVIHNGEADPFGLED